MGELGRAGRGWHVRVRLHSVPGREAKAGGAMRAGGRRHGPPESTRSSPREGWQCAVVALLLFGERASRLPPRARPDRSLCGRSYAGVRARAWAKCSGKEEERGGVALCPAALRAAATSRYKWVRCTCGWHAPPALLPSTLPPSQYTHRGRHRVCQPAQPDPPRMHQARL